MSQRLRHCSVPTSLATLWRLSGDSASRPRLHHHLSLHQQLAPVWLMLLQGLCTIRCSARTCEVYEQQDTDCISYVATTRGKPAGDSFQHSISLPAAAKVILRMLSLQHPGILHIHHIQLESNSDTDFQQEKPADRVGSLQHRQSRGTKSQQAEVQAMLQQMMSSG